MLSAPFNKKPSAQAAGLPNATSALCKINPISKIAVTFELKLQFSCPLKFSISYSCVT